MLFHATAVIRKGKLQPQLTKNALFSDVFENSKMEAYFNEETSIAPSKNDVYIAYCFFHDCTSESFGGAVSAESTSVQRMLIEETSFITCKTTNEVGGAIFFYNEELGECVLFRTCSFNCSSILSDISEGQYSYIVTNNDESSKNEVNESTIAGTKAELYDQWSVLCLGYSNIICSSVNITNNECCYFTALLCHPTASDLVPACSIEYASIVNNTAKNYGCIVLDCEDSSQLIYACNINNNKQDTNNDATISVYTNLFINESCIIGNNKGNKVFYEDCSSCQIIITDCTLDGDIFTDTRYFGSITVISSKKYSFTVELSRIFAGKCESHIDPKRTSDCHRITQCCKCFRRYNIGGVL